MNNEVNDGLIHAKHIMDKLEAFTYNKIAKFPFSNMVDLTLKELNLLITVFRSHFTHINLTWHSS